MQAEVRLMFLPYDDRQSETLADVLVSELNSGKWTEFHCAVAFIRQTGNFQELQKALLDFGTAGHVIELTFGANTFSDTEGSDYEAVETLLKNLRGCPNARLYLFRDPARTFHPKLYVFKSKTAALVIVGSSNWSDGGLIRNVEVNTLLELDLRQAAHLKTYRKIMEMFETYWRGET
jgi:HKD family nuclease